jgi:hypothetical protein
MFHSLFIRCCRPLRRCHHDEGGQLSILTLVVLLCVLILLCLVVNAAHVVRHKLEAQNAADAIAISAATHMARGMNAITAANHIIGELHALVILHQALGGEALDEGNSDDRTDSQLATMLTVAYYDGYLWSSMTPVRIFEDAYDSVSEDVTVEAAIGDARKHLKKVLTYAYLAHALCAKIDLVGQMIPYVGYLLRAIGIPGEIAAYTVQVKTLQEWKTLDGLESMASGLVSIKKLIRDVAIPAVYLYSRTQQYQPQLRADSAAAQLAKYHLVEGSLYPKPYSTYPLLQMPVTTESSRTRGEDVTRTQLMRACVPWVHYWRLGTLRFGDDFLRLSHFKSYYVRYTQEMLISETVRAREASPAINLLVMQDGDVLRMDKGTEPWTRADQADLVDRRFSVMGFALRPKPFLAAPAYFEEPNADGIAAYAQAMIYNANPQRPQRRDRERQAEIGWDTLNWIGNDLPEWEAGNDPAPRENTPTSYFSARAPSPRIRVNWQALLVPSTQVSEAVFWQRGNMGKILRRTNVWSGTARTH